MTVEIMSLLLLSLIVPIFGYWAVSYTLMCKEIVNNIVELIGWRG